MNTTMTPEKLTFNSSANALSILSKLVCKSEYTDDAELLYCAAVEEAEERFGPDSEEVAWLLETMADLYCRQGKSHTAQKYQQRAESILSRVSTSGQCFFN